MRRLGAVMALVMAGSSLAEEPAVAVIPVDRAVIEPVTDAPVKPRLLVTGGWWLSEAKVRERYEEAVRLKAERDSYKKDAENAVWVGFGIGLSIGLAISGGYYLVHTIANSKTVQ